MHRRNVGNKHFLVNGSGIARVFWRVLEMPVLIHGRDYVDVDAKAVAHGLQVKVIRVSGSRSRREC